MGKPARTHAPQPPSKPHPMTRRGHRTVRPEVVMRLDTRNLNTTKASKRTVERTSRA